MQQNDGGTIGGAGTLDESGDVPVLWLAGQDFSIMALIGVVLLVLSLNLLGDAIRDALDPKTRR